MPMPSGRRRRHLIRMLVAAVSICATTAGCNLSQLGNLELTKDNRLTFIAPQTRELVKVPLTVRWKISDFTVTGENGSTSKNAGVFAVFVDTAPIAVGKNISYVGHDDPECRQDVRGCTTATYLNARNVYVTTRYEVTLPVLPAAPMGHGDEQHEVTVVLLDGSGTRRTESAWFVDFRFPRRSDE